MSNFTDFIGGGGGANIPYKGSTAAVTFLSVAEDTYQALDTQGNIVPNSPSLVDFQSPSSASLAQAAGFAQYRQWSLYTGGKQEITMPNGNSLVATGAYTNTTVTGIVFSLLSSAGEIISQHVPFGMSYVNFYNYNYVSIQYAGEDSQYYVFTMFIKGLNYNSNDGDQFGLIVKVDKSTNVISHSTVTTTQLNNSNLQTYVASSSPRMYLARSKAVYCAEFISTGSAPENSTITISTGTVNSSYVGTQVGTSTFTNAYTRNASLFKYDDGSGNFLLMYATSNSALVFKKILVAADGSHAVTDLSVSGLSLGTNYTSQLRADMSSIIESEVTGKYLLNYTYNVIQTNYQKLSYNGTAVTASGFQKYVATSNAANYTFRYDNNNNTNSFNLGQWFYRYAEDKLYIAPRGTIVNSATNFPKGIKWTLGSGNSSNTGVAADVFDDLSKNSTSQSSIMSLGPNGIISQFINTGNQTTMYIQSATLQIFSTLGKTLDKVAYVRQAGNIGATVNISMVEGVTSSDTLPSTYWLNKENMYYSLDNATIIPPTFTYLKLLSNNYATLSVATLNAKALGEDALSIVAPDGKYLVIWKYDTPTANNPASSTGVKIDGNSIYTTVLSYNYVAQTNNSQGKLDRENTPQICKTFSFYRSSNTAEDVTTRLYYYIGEPA